MIPLKFSSYQNTENPQKKNMRSISYTIVNGPPKQKLQVPKAYMKPSTFLESIAIEMSENSDLKKKKKTENDESDFTFNPENRRRKFKSMVSEKEGLKLNMGDLWKEKMSQNKENAPSHSIKPKINNSKGPEQSIMPVCYKVDGPRPFKPLKSFGSFNSKHNSHNLPIKSFPANEGKFSKLEITKRTPLQNLDPQSYRQRSNLQSYSHNFRSFPKNS